MSWVAGALLGLSLVGVAPAGAQTLAESAASLGAGQSVWGGAATRDGPVTILVSIPLQQLFVYRGRALVAVSAVSTGSPGHETPTGAFTILQKDVDHRSNKYSDAPMPYMQRLTWDGVAIHGGRDPGYPASHGCVRVPLGFARRLYAITRLGAQVAIVDAATAPGLPAGYADQLSASKAAARAAAVDPETAATRAANLSVTPAPAADPAGTSPAPSPADTAPAASAAAAEPKTAPTADAPGAAARP